ncbi:hypothetical protein [Brevibacterium aurantiacum]|uniref:hypothetical protein n=1 Tax=Brevibacterium aurantiacum TaxID=273384 RepID=UPI0015E119D2|nr:hypothetical protein [Brevibacterium aurantiacum]
MERGPDNRLGGHIFEITRIAAHDDHHHGRPHDQNPGRTSDVASPTRFNTGEAELHAEQ